MRWCALGLVLALFAGACSAASGDVTLQRAQADAPVTTVPPSSTASTTTVAASTTAPPSTAAPTAAPTTTRTGQPAAGSC